MVEFKFAQYGENFGTRDMGAKIRKELLALLEGDERIVLDFTGVNVVTNSFADECIAKLLLDMPLEELTLFGSRIWGRGVVGLLLSCRKSTLPFWGRFEVPRKVV